MLNSDQVKELKKQLSAQIQHLPPEQREEAQQQIDDMSPDTLESMLKSQQEGSSGKNILRKIVEGSLPSRKIDENKTGIAVLDIRPVSKGHTLLIPKTPVTTHQPLPTPLFTLAKKIAKRIKRKLKPSGVEIQTETKFEEQVINVVPYYEKPLSITSPRYEATQEELESMHRLLVARPRKAPIRKKLESTTYREPEKVLTLKRRIP